MVGYYPISNGWFIYGDADNNTLGGTEVHDEIAGWEGDDVLYSYGGDDLVWGNTGSDWLIGGWGNDTLWGGEGTDYLLGESGNDILVGESGNDFLLGGDGDDTLYGWDGNDYLIGGEGNDVLFGDYGDDTLSGGSGADTFLFGYNWGNDVITDANWNDTILLHDIIPWQSDVSCWYDIWSETMYFYTPTSTLQVNCATGDYYNPRTYPVYQYADGSRWSYIWSGVNSNSNWYQISYDAAEDTGAEIASNPLWGDANTFYGTDAADNIFLSKNDGNDLVFDAAQGDTIHFYDALLSDVIATAVSDNAVAIAFNTGETAVVAAEGTTSATFKLASGESYVYNRETSSWQQS